MASLGGTVTPTVCPSSQSRGQQPCFLAEEAGASPGVHPELRLGSAPRSFHILLFCHQKGRLEEPESGSCWGGGEGWCGKVQEDFITQCLLGAPWEGLPPAGRHAWPAWVITSQHFILLVSFHFLGMWAPKYFIPVCSLLLLSRQTAGLATGLELARGHLLHALPLNRCPHHQPRAGSSSQGVWGEEARQTTLPETRVGSTNPEHLLCWKPGSKER